MIDLDAIERGARTGALPALIDELAASADDAMRLLARALRLDLTVLAAHPELAYPCLYRRGAWSSAAAADFFAGRSGAASASPLRPLLDEWRPRGPWLRALRPPPVPLEGALLEEYRGDLAGGAPVFARDGSAIGARGPGGAVAWDRGTGARLSPAEIASRLPDDPPARFALQRGDGWGRCDLLDRSTDRRCEIRVDNDTSFDCAVDAPGGHAIAAGWFLDYNGVVVRVDPAAARVVWRTELVRWIQTLSISPDGALVLAGDGACHHLIDAATGRTLGRLDVAGAVQVSPDGSQIALRHGDALQIWDLDGIRRGEHAPATPPAGLIDAAFSPDGARLITGGLLCDGVTGELVARLDVDGGSYLEGGPPANGRRLTDRLFIEASPLDGLRAWDAATGELVLRNVERRHRVGDLFAVSPDGESYASSRGRGAPLAIRSVRDGTELGRIDLPVAGAVVFSLDGSRIAAATDAGEVWIADRAGADLTHVGVHPCQIHDLAFAHDGSLLASRDVERRVRLWDMRRGLLDERTDPDWRPLADSIHGWSGFRAHAHPFRTRTAAGLAEILDERSGRVIARIPADEELVADAQGRRWASRAAHMALEDLEDPGP